MSGKWPIQFDEKPFVLAPRSVYGNVQVEENARAEDRLQLDARLGADPFDHLAALADDDRLLRLALDDDGRVDLDEVLLFVLFPTVDRDGRRVRQFLGGMRQQLLAHDLGREEALRLRGEVLGRIDR